jgi:hypothetical protein
VKFIGTDTDIESETFNKKALPALGPSGMGRLKDMCLWGDQHRILQVIINLVSNSLKFTPEGGKVEGSFLGSVSSYHKLFQESRDVVHLSHLRTLRLLNQCWVLRNLLEAVMLTLRS